MLCTFGSAAAGVVGSGHVVSETRAVSGFHGIELRGSGDVVLTQGNTEGVVVEGEDNILPLVETTVNANGILVLGIKQHTEGVSYSKPLIFKVAAKAVDAIMVAGSGSLHCESLASDHLRVELPGSGEVGIAHLKADAVNVEINGSGNVDTAGEVHAQKLVIDGSGDYLAEKLKSDEATVMINGSGGAKLWTTNTLSAVINGSGEVEYRGDAQVNKVVHGSGQVHQAR